MYIKSIKFHFNTSDEILEVSGSYAQTLYDSDPLKNEYVRVQGKGEQVLIPRSSILYLQVIENEKANRIYYQIMARCRKISRVTERISMDEIYDMQETDECWFEGWEVRNGVFCIDDEAISTDQNICDLVSEVILLNAKLEDAKVGDVDV